MSSHSPEKIVLGLGGTVDYEILLDPKIMQEIIEEYVIRQSELSSFAQVSSPRDLIVSLLSFMRAGTGGERFVASSEIIESIASRFSKRITLGGTCVRAAIAMEIFGIHSTLHLVSISDDVRRLLPKSSKYICSSDVDTFDPHLIVQFADGIEINSGDIHFVTPQPNRVIFTNDPPNRELVLSDDLGSVLKGAEIFMISGFNCIQDPEILELRLADIKRHMKNLNSEAIVFFEDAGYHVPSLSRRVREELIDVIDIFSMNEEELQSYLGRSLDLLDAEGMQVALSEIRSIIPAPTLVIHTKHWAVALGDRCLEYEGALRGGIVMASTRYCFGDGVTSSKYAEVSRYEPNKKSVEFARKVNSAQQGSILCVPALDLQVKHPTTIGLGDTFVGGFIAQLV